MRILSKVKGFFNNANFIFFFLQRMDINIESQISMSVLSVGKELVKKFDLFSSSQFLRFKSDAETKTLTGGVVSLGIMLFLTITFATMIIDTFDKVLITAVADSTQADEPPSIFF